MLCLSPWARVRLLVLLILWRRRLIAISATDHTFGMLSSYWSNLAIKSVSVVGTTSVIPSGDIHFSSTVSSVSMPVSGVHVCVVGGSALSLKSTALSLSTTSAS